MGIHQLSKVIGDSAPKAIKSADIKSYFGRKVAIDASMSIYQFLIAVRQEGNMLTNSEGESTSHLMGMFYRTIRMIENGIKPVYVFDGKPPDMKAGELDKRAERREESEKGLMKAQELEDTEAVEKFSKRLVKVTPQHGEDCKKLLKLLGIPYVQAPCEAEAQCAALAKSGKVYAVGTEDMDALTFGAPVLLRHLTFSEARKLPIQEFNLQAVLEGMELNMDQFVDLCILLGCDYCESIKGIGPKKAVELLTKYGSIEAILPHIEKTKYSLPADWPYAAAKKLFLNPKVDDPAEIELKWCEPDEEGLVDFMSKTHGFNEERIRSGAKKLVKARTSVTQGRIDSFFSLKPVVKSEIKTEQSDSSKSKPIQNGKRKSQLKASGGSNFKSKKP